MIAQPPASLVADVSSSGLPQATLSDRRSTPTTWHQAKWQPTKRLFPHAAILLALGWWALPLTRSGAGVDAWSMAAALLACVPLLVVTRAWQIRWPYLAVALVPGMVALALNFTSRTGWTGLGDAAAWLYAGLLGLGVLAYAVTPRRRLLVVTIIGVAGLDQFGQGWLAWWGQGDIHAMISGTIGWHNQFGAFVAAPLILAWCLVIRGSGAARLAAALLVPWLGAGVLLSGSRATIGLVLLAAMTLMVLVIRSWGELARLTGCVLSAPAAVWLLSGSWFMPGSGGVAATALSRDQAAEGNFLVRFHYDWAGLILASKHPLTGSGFDSFGVSGAQYMPADTAASEFVHNGWVQALVDGGILWLLPVVLATAWPAIRAVRRLLAGRRNGANAIQIGVSLALLVLLGHALFDTDWRYPSLLALYAVLAALVPWRSRTALRQVRVATFLGSTVLAMAVVCALGASVVDTTQTNPEAVPPVWVKGIDDLTSVRDLATRLPTSAADQARLLASSGLPDATFSDLMARTAAAAEDNPTLAQIRALALARRGQTDAARQLSESSLPALPRPPVVVWRAEVLAETDGVAPARAWVQLQLDRLRALQGGVPLAELEEWLSRHPATVTDSDRNGRVSISDGGEVAS
ncbi:MAG TPA: O-antigen ligase family protein [Actinomycetes bacterium]|nr:O-antigen ligase family protein [Actinomycetes bacterium]